MCHQLQPGKAVFAVNIAAKCIICAVHLYITNKMKRFSFKSGCVIRVAKHVKEDCFIVLQ